MLLVYTRERTRAICSYNLWNEIFAYKKMCQRDPFEKWYMLIESLQRVVCKNV